ncbi:MAG: hypothetical protein R3D84_10715 [Paracoccaceae bacterium]
MTAAELSISTEPGAKVIFEAFSSRLISATFFGRGQGGKRIKGFVIGDRNLEALALSQLVGKDPRYGVAGVGAAGDTGNFHQIGLNLHFAVVQVGQRLQPGQHAHGQPDGSVSSSRAAE